MLFDVSAYSRVVLDAEGKLGLRVGPASAAVYPARELGPGCHRLSASVSGGPITFGVVVGGRATRLSEGATIEVPSAGERPTLRATSDRALAVVREVRFSPCDGEVGR